MRKTSTSTLVVLQASLILRYMSPVSEVIRSNQTLWRPPLNDAFLQYTQRRINDTVTCLSGTEKTPLDNMTGHFNASELPGFFLVWFLVLCLLCRLSSSLLQKLIPFCISPWKCSPQPHALYFVLELLVLLRAEKSYASCISGLSSGLIMLK